MCDLLGRQVVGPPEELRVKEPKSEKQPITGKREKHVGGEGISIKETTCAKAQGREYMKCWVY